MSFRTFILSLSVSFGVAWLAIVIVPYFKMRSLEPMMMNEDEGTDSVFQAKRAGRIADGAKVYAENGCYICHTQVIRPTYAGNDMFRSDWAGLANDPDRGDTRRETNAFDFRGEKFAHIGISRLGPDLSNLGRRVETIYAPDGDPEQWLYRYLYNPRFEPERRLSTCPSVRFLFVERKIHGNRADNALPFQGRRGEEIVPGPDARALVSYLLSLRKDQPVPAALNFSPTAAETAPAPLATSGAGEIAPAP
jgi:cytochrome c oxidase cbb3-type subunit II